MVDPRVTELFGAYLEHSPFAKLLGLRLEEMEPEKAVVVLPYREELTTFADVVHGGAIATLVDLSAVAAAWSAVTEAGSTTGATVSSSVNFISAARASDLIATARVSRRTGSFCFCEVDVTDAGERLIAQAIATYKIAGSTP